MGTQTLINKGTQLPSMIRDTLKLQRHKTWKKGDNQYYKWVVVIPDSVINDLEWNEQYEKAQKNNKQVELEAKAKNGKLLIEKKD